MALDQWDKERVRKYIREKIVTPTGAKVVFDLATSPTDPPAQEPDHYKTAAYAAGYKSGVNASDTALTFLLDDYLGRELDKDPHVRVRNALAELIELRKLKPAPKPNTRAATPAMLRTLDNPSPPAGDSWRLDWTRVRDEQ